jgi:hypothetical protein
LIEKGKEGNEISNKQITHFKGELGEKLLQNTSVVQQAMEAAGYRIGKERLSTFCMLQS